MGSLRKLLQSAGSVTDTMSPIRSLQVFKVGEKNIKPLSKASP